MEIQDKTGRENVIKDHLSHLGPEASSTEEFPVDDSFLDDQLLAISHQAGSWYSDFVNFKVGGVMPSRLSYQQRMRYLSNAKYYVLEEPLLYKLYRDGVYRRRLLEDEVSSALHLWCTLWR